MNKIRLFRKRFIPDEIVELKDDEILYFENNILITKWDVLKPRKDIDHGISVYFIDKGVKVSKVYNARNDLIYYYCDIIDTSVTKKNTDEETTTEYVFSDLLADVLVYPDGFVRVVDLDELSTLLINKTLSSNLIAKALQITNNLLTDIYNGEFNKYTKYIDDIEKSEGA